MTAKEHNRLIAIFHLVEGGLQTFSGIIGAVICGIIGAVFAANARRPDEQIMGTVFIVLAFVFALIGLIFGGINLVAGYKLIKEKDGARTWGIVASILCLMGFPLGTALGVYGLWFLFNEEGKRFYLGNNSYAQNAFPPPPPNNWQ